MREPDQISICVTTAPEHPTVVYHLTLRTSCLCRLDDIISVVLAQNEIYFGDPVSTIAY